MEKGTSWLESFQNAHGRDPVDNVELTAHVIAGSPHGGFKKTDVGKSLMSLLNAEKPKMG